MPRIRTLSPRRITTIVTFAILLGGSVQGSPFNVYYRANANSPWVFYAGKASGDAANATVADLQATGYSAQAVAGDATGNGTVVAPGVTYGNSSQSPTVVVNRTNPARSPYGTVIGGSLANTWGGSSTGYSYGGGAAYGGGAFRHADNWHHHEYAHSNEGHHDGQAAARHPTAHPHQRAAAHRSHAGAGHAGQHGSHHGHSHSHSHSHSHHGKK